jgi:hypothetical protein
VLSHHQHLHAHFELDSKDRKKALKEHDRSEEFKFLLEAEFTFSLP